MKKEKTHLTRTQRYQIEALLQTGATQERIAAILNKNKSVISREIRRNSGRHGKYTAKYAQMLCDERKERFKRPRKLTPPIQQQIASLLQEEQWSPQQIAGYCSRKGIPMVSHKRIYQFIRADRQAGGKLYTHLRHQLKHLKRPIAGKGGVIKDRVSIEERPAIVDERARIGD